MSELFELINAMRAQVPYMSIEELKAVEKELKAALRMLYERRS